MRKLFMKMARFFVVLYANRVYNKQVRIADELHCKNQDRYYVTFLDSWGKLHVINRSVFRKYRNTRGFKDTILNVKSGAFYHTADRGEFGGLSPIETEARRRCFVDHAVKSAGLFNI